MNKIKQFIDVNKNKLMVTGTLVGTALTSNLNAYAAINTDTSTIDTFIDFIADWMVKIGGAVALVGGIMFALAFQREDSEGKTRGLQTIMAGLMAAAIAVASKSLFNVGTKG